MFPINVHLNRVQHKHRVNYNIMRHPVLRVDATANIHALYKLQKHLRAIRYLGHKIAHSIRAQRSIPLIRLIVGLRHLPKCPANTFYICYILYATNHQTSSATTTRCDFACISREFASLPPLHDANVCGHRVSPRVSHRINKRLIVVQCASKCLCVSHCIRCYPFRSVRIIRAEMLRARKMSHCLYNTVVQRVVLSAKSLVSRQLSRIWHT